LGVSLVVVTDEAVRRAEMRALAHPLRLRMLSLLTGAELSAAEVARELGTTQANASYHLRRLAAAGMLGDAGEVAVRGGRARRYRHVPADAAPPAKGSAVDPTGRAGPDRTGQAALAHAVVRALAGELVRRDLQRDTARLSHLTDAELWVDPGAWTRALHDVQSASLRLHDQARPPRTPGTVRVNASMVLFAMTGGVEPPVEPPVESSGKLR